MNGGKVFWAKGDRLWHAIEDGEINTFCDRYIKPPRETMRKADPSDDVRCAKCDRILRSNGGKNGEG